MNGGMIRFILGSVLKVESALLLFPCIVAVFYKESAGYWFLCTAVLSFVLGYLLSRKKPHNTVFYLKEGCVTTAMSWIVISLVGCLPFYLSGEIPMLCLRRFPVLQQLVPVFYRMLNVCRRAFFSGGVSVIGSAVWAYWYSFWLLFR